MLTQDEMITALIEDVETWDTETLVDVAKASLEEVISTLSAEEIAQMYHDNIGDRE